MIDYNITAITNNRGHNIIYMDTKTLLDYLRKEQLFEKIGRRFNRSNFKTWCYKNSLTHKHKGVVKDNKNNILPNQRPAGYTRFNSPITKETKGVCHLHITDGSWNLEGIINDFFSTNWHIITDEYEARANIRRNGSKDKDDNLYPYKKGTKEKPMCHIDIREMRPVMYLPYELTYSDAIKLQKQINAVIKDFKPSKVEQTKRYKSGYFNMLGEKCIKKWFNWELDGSKDSYRSKWKYVGDKDEKNISN